MKLSKIGYTAEEWLTPLGDEKVFELVLLGLNVPLKVVEPNADEMSRRGIPRPVIPTKTANPAWNRSSLDQQDQQMEKRQKTAEDSVPPNNSQPIETEVEVGRLKKELADAKAAATNAEAEMKKIKGEEKVKLRQADAKGYEARIKREALEYTQTVHKMVNDELEVERWTPDTRDVRERGGGGGGDAVLKCLSSAMGRRLTADGGGGDLEMEGLLNQTPTKCRGGAFPGLSFQTKTANPAQNRSSLDQQDQQKEKKQKTAEDSVPPSNSQPIVLDETRAAAPKEQQNVPDPQASKVSAERERYRTDRDSYRAKFRVSESQLKENEAEVRRMKKELADAKAAATNAEAEMKKIKGEEKEKLRHADA
ncbi:hypothetical protein RHGRI_028169 [Rhododendron griersonianum]|uniref:Uncharacterized protein n=1 Tax=Rhododendron griersonianum TaxID=479676 RepID=A0AAV6IES5_9ERIC|nr:hypothetical protein RHGRI_028169 [Rhododendron griersonianum]